MTTILEICQDVSALVSTQKPTSLFIENSQQSRIFLSLAEATLESLKRYGAWQSLEREGVIITCPMRNRYPLKEFHDDVDEVLFDTVHIACGGERVSGALSSEEFVHLKGKNLPSSTLFYKFENDSLVFLNPIEKCFHVHFRYRSNGVVKNTVDDETVFKPRITQDSDVPVFDSYLVKLGIMWRWYKRNGMAYMEEFQEYEQEVKRRFAGEIGARDICLGGAFFVAGRNFYEPNFKINV